MEEDMQSTKSSSKSKNKSNPRKFSEKIALLKKKEAEINNSFNVVMKDVKIASETTPNSFGSSICGALESSNISGGNSPFGYPPTVNVSYLTASPADTNSTVATVSIGLSGENSPMTKSSMTSHFPHSATTYYIKEAPNLGSGTDAILPTACGVYPVSMSQPNSQQTSPQSAHQASVSPELLHPSSASSAFYSSQLDPSQYKTASLPNVPVVVMHKGSSFTDHSINSNENKSPRSFASHYQLTAVRNSCLDEPELAYHYHNYNPTLIVPSQPTPASITTAAAGMCFPPAALGINDNKRSYVGQFASVQPTSQPHQQHQLSSQKSPKSSREQLAEHVRSRLYHRMQASQLQKPPQQQYPSVTQETQALNHKNVLWNGISPHNPLAMSSDSLIIKSPLAPVGNKNGMELSSAGHQHYRHTRHSRQRSDMLWPYPNVSALGLHAAASSASASALCIASSAHASLPQYHASDSMHQLQMNSANSHEILYPLALSNQMRTIASTANPQRLTVADQDSYRRVSSDSAINGRFDSTVSGMQPSGINTDRISHFFTLADPQPHDPPSGSIADAHSANLYQESKSKKPGTILFNLLNDTTLQNENPVQSSNFLSDPVAMDTYDSLSIPLPESLTMEEFSNIPDIVLTTDDQNNSGCRRDSSTMAAEVLSSCIYLGQGTCEPSGKSILDLNQDDMQLLMNPSYTNYVTDDMTEAQLWREQQRKPQNESHS